MKNILYKALVRFRLTRPVVKKIEHRFCMIYALDPAALMKKTNQELWKLCLILVISMGILWVAGRKTFYQGIMSVLVVYMLGMNSIYAEYDRVELLLLRQLDRFIQDIRFRFQFDGMLEEALTDTVQDAEREMALQGIRMLDSLKAHKNNTLKDAYEDWAPNHFFLTFYALCETVIIYGDKKVENKSLFLSNLGYLKEDIHTEILKREKQKSLFMGLFGVTILPVFGIGFIEQWGIQNMPELYDFYNGIPGAVITVLMFGIALAIFWMIMKLRYSLELQEEKSQWVEKLLEHTWIENRVIRTISRHYKKYYQLEKELKSIVYPYNVKELLVRRSCCGMMLSLIVLILCFSIGISGIEVFGIPHSGLLISLFCGGLAGFFGYELEYVNILLRKKILEINREEEVVRFQSIILILMHMDRVNVELILEWMEQFAVVFKREIEIIADDLSYRGIQTFYDAKDRIGYLPFERILDSFIACDRMGIAMAFSGIVSDRLYYIEKHKQENEMIMNNKALVAKTISFVPLCMVILCELIIPFVYFGFNKLSMFQLQL